MIVESRLVNIEKLMEETRADVKEMSKAMTTLVLQEQRLLSVEKAIVDIKENKRELWKEFHAMREESIARKAAHEGRETAPQTSREVWDSIVAGAAAHGMWIVIATGIGILMTRFIK